MECLVGVLRINDSVGTVSVTFHTINLYNFI